MSKFQVAESVASTWSYHIAEAPEDSRSPKPLCGMRTIMMRTSIPLEAWGAKTHLNERYCEACRERYDELTRTP